MQALYSTQQELMQKEIEARQELLRLQEVDRFEKTQVSVLGLSSSAAKKVETRVIDGKVFKGIKTPEGTIFVPDMASLSAAEKEKAYESMKELDKSGKKPSMPSFWVPSLTPEAAPTVIEALPSKLELQCTACDPPHPIASFKKLVKVNFTTESKTVSREKEPGAIEEPTSYSSDKPSAKVCPSCVKTFTNGSKIMIAKLCGHAVCKDCFSRFIKGSGKCHVCDRPCKTGDAFELFVEGTGFASSGGLDKMAKSVGVAFQ
ncbi:UNVERIFIED_CONTAM: hypothetical protein HDU68_002335 [Siphonaria sp. JEL0065]|nr:hypothetical protein HDU68_002335 [Siphonaria sp. JEL0065]